MFKYLIFSVKIIFKKSLCLKYFGVSLLHLRNK